MKRRKWLALTLCVLVAGPVHAQTIGQGLTVLGEVLQGIGKDQADRARRAQDSTEASQRGAMLMAAARRDSAAVAMQVQGARNAQLRADAAARLFSQRASFILNATADSLGIGVAGSVTRDSLFAEANVILPDLFAVNPEASGAQIRDVLEPVIAKYKQLYSGFLTRSEFAIDSVIAVRRIPRLKQRAFAEAALPWLEAKLQTDITANTWDLGQVVGVAADSAGAASWDHIQKPIPAAPRKKKP